MSKEPPYRTSAEKPKTVRVNLRELLDIHAKIVEELEEQGYRDLDIDGDYYWSITRERLYDVFAQPREEDLGIGQLSEDYDFLCSVRDDGHAVPASLKWLATLLRAYAHQVESNAASK